jgi:hypothetical protein
MIETLLDGKVVNTMNEWHKVGTMQNVSLELEWKALGFCFQVQVTSDIK